MSVAVDHHGFVIDATRVSWSSVLTIATYKRDLFTYDDICLAFEVGPGRWVEVSEEEAGFAELAKAVERAFPEVPGDWFGTVMLPPFEANRCVLWRKGAGPRRVD